MATPPTPTAATPQPNPITIRLPSKYTPSTPATTTFTPPPLPFLHRTWSVTHSTLTMWRTARNVRITYGPLPPGSTAPPRARLSDTVEYEPLAGSAGRPKRVSGTDTTGTPGDTGAWDWRGRGWLFWVGSHWEVLGWGEWEDPATRVRERWVVTWFRETVFTEEGVDVYFERREGGSEGLVRAVLAELRRVARGCGRLERLLEGEMREVSVVLPWAER
ncbi:hypothetical protein BT67DRAFT_423883 [Trichocladium antarcticum]|uniref:Uncharacterized protein n=1 Tax=Trichocladium antarcticum TaxID=1450529 RepID=A0AAN6UI75_9PEZI|nr:hypothetical protein BT67DRAFT_423883 [Trichocladium antarcticum]